METNSKPYTMKSTKKGHTTVDHKIRHHAKLTKERKKSQKGKENEWSFNARSSDSVSDFHALRCIPFAEKTKGEGEWVRVECAALTQWSNGNNQVKLIFDITEKRIFTSNDVDDDNNGERDAVDNGEDDDGSFLTHEKP